MSPELHFILILLLRMMVAAGFVVTASIITERSGPVIGALVATLPVSAGPSYVFLALDHDAAFIAQGALSSLPVMRRRSSCASPMWCWHSGAASW
jgi:energy-converting hydrogenase Eha subunit E